MTDTLALTIYGFISGIMLDRGFINSAWIPIVWFGVSATLVGLWWAWAWFMTRKM